MDYLLDSNIILTYSRSDKITRRLEANYKIFDGQNRIALSVVSKGEIEAAILKLGLGEGRKRRIQYLMNRLTIFGINFDKIIQKYAEIDAYSQGKIKTPTAKFSSRNMGKNDLWIAATASAFDLQLVTMDKDFNHLAPSYIDLLYVETT
jgi:tRNA(fMet)-specific endonuclease VapC